MKYFIADTETTVYNGQDSTEVWASAIFDLENPLEKQFVQVFNNLEKLVQYVFTFEDDCNIYFHNLKFDGMFLWYWIVSTGQFKLASYEKKGKVYLEDRKTFKKGGNDRYTYTISDKGIWYSLTIKHNGHIYSFMDSLKILPFSVETIGEAFKTKYRKTSIEYTGIRHANGVITLEEEDYIKNDVLVVAEAINIMFEQGHDKSTIGANCLNDFKHTSIFGDDSNTYRKVFPDLYKCECPIDGYSNADEYIRKSYRGGWCYVKKGIENQLIDEHITIADVNSLYPSMMHSDSGNYYPYGKPQWWSGDIPTEVLEQVDGHRKYYYFIRVKCKFHIKPNHLPTIMIKGSIYPPREWLESSVTTYGSEKVKQIIDYDGALTEYRPTLTLTCTDWELFQEHYEIEDLEILDGCYFRCAIGLFDEYINHWAEIKQNSKGAMRTLAKLFLNNLYGKFASSDESSYKILTLMESTRLCVGTNVEAHDKQSGYIAVGSAITSYARAFTITAAQKNYDNFLYADTDSVHAKCLPSELIGIPEHPTKFNHWKYEAEADQGIYVRAKRYIEHVILEDHEAVDPYYNIKCAGMGKNCKKFVENKLQNGTMKLSEFKSGLIVPNNLKARNIDGGIILIEQDFHLH